jgi:hydrogenase nickel incorporation protein HypA/HybF
MVKMHEFSIAVDVMDNAIEEAKKHNATRIKEISLEIGRLALINPEQMKFALETLSTETIAEGVMIELEILPLRVECAEKHVNELDLEGEDLYSIVSKLRCPECQGKVEVLGGRECILKRIVAE